MFGLKNKEEQPSLTIPKHIGIIMDGIGRWAQTRMQPRVFGHKAGMEALQEVAKGEANKIFIPFEATSALSSLGAVKDVISDSKNVKK